MSDYWRKRVCKKTLQKNHVDLIEKWRIKVVKEDADMNKSVLPVNK